MKDICGNECRGEKRVYVEPEVERREKLEDVAEGAQPVVTGAAPAD